MSYPAVSAFLYSMLLPQSYFESSSLSHARYDQPVKWYQAKWGSEHKGEAEVILPDKTRADCLTSTQAIEFDFATKWAEAIGQTLYYRLQTGKKPGVVTIMEREKDYSY